MPLFPKLSIPQVGFQRFQQPTVQKVTGASPYAALTAQRQGIRIADIEGNAEKGANKGVRSLMTKGY